MENVGKVAAMPDQTRTTRLHLGRGDGDAAKRVARWRTAMAPFGEVVLTPEEAAVFTASLTARTIGGSISARAASSHFRLLRSRAMVRGITADYVFVNTLLEGRIWGRAGPQRIDIAAGATTVQSLSMAVDLRFRSAAWLAFIVPRSTWDAEVGVPVPAGGLHFPAPSAECVLIGGHLRSLVELTDPIDAAQNAMIGRASFALLRETLGGTAPQAGRSNPGPEPLAHAVRRLIEANLTDPAFGIEAIRRHFGLSRFKLRRVMGPSGSDLSQAIRRLRLLKARREIASPGSLDRSLAEIGRSWGIDNERSFRRAFLHEFGYGPAELRRRVRSGEVLELLEDEAVIDLWFRGG